MRRSWFDGTTARGLDRPGCFPYEPVPDLLHDGPLARFPAHVALQTAQEGRHTGPQVLMRAAHVDQGQGWLYEYLIAPFRSPAGEGRDNSGPRPHSQL